jgi:Lar family restriction alleviation protein|nr:MAG TPA: restriction alleviation protein [Caudoviricetes sp.]
MTNKLKPCPFCGETEFIGVNFKRLFNMDFHYVRCWICGARGPRNLHKGKAIELWNESWKKENE